MSFAEQARPIERRAAGSRARRRRSTSATRVASRSSTSPVSPSTRISSTPFTGVANSGSPAAAASSATSGNPS